MATVDSQKLLQKWFPHTTSPFIANAPMLGFTDLTMAKAVNKAGGFGTIYTPGKIKIPNNINGHHTMLIFGDI